MQRSIDAQVRRIERYVGEDLTRLRTDAGATKAQVARIAGIDRTFLGRVESGTAHASVATLVAYATAIGAEVSVRVYAGRGPRLTDRHQARMIELVLRELHPLWRVHLEVAVSRPICGVIDAVFERRDDPLLVIAEFESMLPRLEQHLRWIAEKARAIGSSEVVGDGPIPATSRLVVLRSTVAARAIANEFESTLRAAYPAPARAAVDALRRGTAWPGPAVVWVRIEGQRVELLDGPPRGVLLGR